MEILTNKVKTELVNCVETACGEAILTMRRWHEEKQVVIAETGLSSVVYESSVDYYLDNLGWTQEQFDKYWNNGGEEKEINNYIDRTVELYNDDSVWEEIA